MIMNKQIKKEVPIGKKDYVFGNKFRKEVKPLKKIKCNQ